MDDDDKIRRNLMVTSAIIIGVAWFDVSLPDMLERLFSIKQPAGTPGSVVQLSNWKVWLAALVVLGYMSWRYRWSDEVEAAGKLFSETVGGRYHVVYRDRYLSEVSEWFRIGRIPKNADPNVTVAYNQLVPENLVRQIGRPPDTIELTSLPPVSMHRAAHTAMLHAIWSTDSGAGHINQQQIQLHIDPTRQRALVWRARWYVLTNSKASMSLVWPVLVAGTAALIVLYKLGRAIFG